MVPSEILIVANRLPVIAQTGSTGQREFAPAPGGLVAALAPIAAHLSCTWLGWQGGGPETECVVDGMTLCTVSPPAAQYTAYYEGFANQVLWPIFHELPEYAAPGQPAGVPPHAGKPEGDWWEAYRNVNEHFAQRIAQTANTGALVWLQDYHLLLVPRLLRELRPDLRIALFLHIPFPPASQLAPHSWAAELLAGVGAADVIGVQRESDAAHLRDALRTLAPGTKGEVRAIPISIDTAPYAAAAAEALAAGEPGKLRERYGIRSRQMLLSVDRLDYTKGILERLDAFERVLERWPQGSPLPVLVQVLTPTREHIAAYRDYAQRVREATARISERFAVTGYAPVVTLSDPHSARELVSLYLAADVMCVTPLRDGMNLVAKEFAVSRIDEGGVLVLGLGAGAADELRAALRVDPRDLRALAETIERALRMDPADARSRARELRDAVYRRDVYAWATDFLAVAIQP